MISLRRTPKQIRSKQLVQDLHKSLDILIEKDPLSAITVQHISKIAGISAGSIYQYFPTKKEIFKSFFSKRREKIIVRFQENMRKSDNKELKEFVKILIESCMEVIRLQKAVRKFTLGHFPSLAVQQLKELDPELIKVMIATFQQRFPEWQPSTHQEFVTIVFGMIFGPHRSMLPEVLEISEEQLSPIIARLLENYIESERSEA